MFWVVQQDLFLLNQRAALLDTLRRLGIPHQCVTLGADGEITPEVAATGAVITNGSILLSRIAVARGWYPGSFLTSAFDYDVWQPLFDEHLLNRDAVMTTLAAADPQADSFFIRPRRDDKSFTGRVMTRPAFKSWQAAILAGRGALPPDTPILYAPVKRLGQEHRHFIVDGAVVSSSRYKLGGGFNQTAMVDRRVIDFAARMAAIWQPARAFVMDTYVADREVGIVEIGGLCHAGFYAADVQKIVVALESMPLDAQRLAGTTAEAGAQAVPAPPGDPPP